MYNETEVLNKTLNMETIIKRPKTRGELMDLLRQNIKCEVVATNEEITSLLLEGWASDIKFKTTQSNNFGWVIYELIKS